ncbi:hypothetical protein [Xenorhabdus taiwanensis]|uniref:Phage protein n=1 Tax=Xenorhabdus taiwanensis TaxID=3085177 RepID=A0ABN7C5U8_9GAMM|nr:hypothetical protein TCT1_22540 [Xenorhabdus sp. TCT-1]BET97754.1 hypothetical protein TCT1_26750 [Xenorhabdus sp. TCT-1]
MKIRLYDDAVIKHASNCVEISTDQYSKVGMECTMAERMDSGQWGMNELAEYLTDRDLVDSLMEELGKMQRRVA